MIGFVRRAASAGCAAAITVGLLAVGASPASADDFPAAGQCYKLTTAQLNAEAWPIDSTTVSCDAPHNVEVAFADQTDASTEEAMKAALAARCNSVDLTRAVGGKFPNELSTTKKWALVTTRRYSWRDAAGARLACAVSTYSILRSGKLLAREVSMPLASLLDGSRASSDAAGQCLGTGTSQTPAAYSDLRSVDCAKFTKKPSRWTFLTWRIHDARQEFQTRYPGEKEMVAYGRDVCEPAVSSSKQWGPAYYNYPVATDWAIGLTDIHCRRALR